MTENKNKERVMIFIDGSNLYHLVKRMFPDKKPIEFNFKKFVSYLAGDRKLIRTHYYTAPLDRTFDEKISYAIFMGKGAIFMRQNIPEKDQQLAKDLLSKLN